MSNINLNTLFLERKKKTPDQTAWEISEEAPDKIPEQLLEVTLEKCLEKREHKFINKNSKIVLEEFQ